MTTSTLDPNFSKMGFDKKGRMFAKVASTIPLSQTFRELAQNALEAGAENLTIRERWNEENNRRFLIFEDDGPGVAIEQIEPLLADLGESGHSGQDNMGIGARMTASYYFTSASFTSRINGGLAASIEYYFDPTYGPVVKNFDGHSLRHPETHEWTTRKTHGSIWALDVTEHPSIDASYVTRYLTSRYFNIPEFNIRLGKVKHPNQKGLKRDYATDSWSKSSSSDGVAAAPNGWKVHWWVFDDATANSNRTRAFFACRVNNELFNHSPHPVSGGNKNTYNRFGIWNRSAKAQIALIVEPPDGMFEMDAGRNQVFDKKNKEAPNFDEIGAWFAQNQPEAVKKLTAPFFERPEGSAETIADLTKKFKDQYVKMTTVNLSSSGDTHGGGIGQGATVSEREISEDKKDSRESVNERGPSGSENLSEPSTSGKKGISSKGFKPPDYQVFGEDEFDEEALRLGVPLFVDMSNAMCLVNKDHKFFEAANLEVMKRLGSSDSDAESREKFFSEVVNSAGILGAVHMGLVKSVSKGYGVNVKESVDHLCNKASAWYPSLYSNVDLVSFVVGRLKNRP